MAKYDWKGSVLSITLDDAEGAAVDVAMDMDKLSPAVKEAAARFGIQTALRNATAGKMDDLPVARKNLLAKAAVFDSGVWAEAATKAAAVSLTDAEKTEVIGDVIVQAKQAKGDKRPKAEILAAFTALDDATKEAVVKSLAKPIESAMKTKLKQKKAAGKSDIPNF